MLQLGCKASGCCLEQPKVLVYQPLSIASPSSAVSIDMLLEQASASGS